MRRKCSCETEMRACEMEMPAWASPGKFSTKIVVQDFCLAVDWVALH